MKVVLVQPPSYDWVTPSNGIALIQAHLKAAGLRPLVVDSSMRVRQSLCRRLRRRFAEHAEYHRALARNKAFADKLLAREVAHILSKRPDVAAFAVLTYTERWALDLAAGIKRARPGCKVVFGGPQCLRKNNALDHIKNPLVDAVMLGEADVSFVKYLRALARSRGGRLPRIPGVLHKEDGAIVDGGDEEAVVDIDKLPFMDFSGFPMRDYRGDVIYLNTTRSCLRRCRFCTHFLMQKTYSVMSPERTLREIEHQLEIYPGRRLVVFSDSLVNGDVKRLGRLADLLIGYRLERLGRFGKKGDFGWTGMAILHRTMTPEVLRKLAGSGCRMLSYGLESGSQKVVDLMEKKFKVEEAEEVIRDTHAAGIQARTYLQFGFPGETDDDFQKTLGFIRRNAKHLSHVSISFSEIYKGSDLDLRPEAHGIRTPIADRTRWVSVDGSNTYEVRQERCRRAARLARGLGIGVVEVFASKLGFDNYDF